MWLHKVESSAIEDAMLWPLTHKVVSDHFRNRCIGGAFHTMIQGCVSGILKNYVVL